MFRIENDSAARKAVLRVIAAAVSASGIYAFIKRKVGSYLFMQVMFAFFDYSENRAVFFADYIAMTVLFAAAGHYLSILLRRAGERK